MSDGGMQPEPFRRGFKGKPHFNQTTRVGHQSNVSAKLIKPFGSVYYPPDGTGRDTYIINHHGGTCNEAAFDQSGINMANNKFLRDLKHAPFETPKNYKLSPLVEKYMEIRFDN